MLFYVIFNFILLSLVHGRVDQHAKKSMFYETSPLQPCMAQEFAMLYDTLWHWAHTGAQLSGSGAQLSGSGAQLSGSGRSCRQYRHTYIRHI